MVLGALAAAGPASSHAAAAGYKIVDRIPMGSISLWDYAAIDGQTRRLLLATGYSANDGVTAYDLDSHQIVKQLPGVRMTHGIVPLGNGVAAVADGAQHLVRFFDERTGKATASVAIGEPPRPEDWHNPDALLLEPKTGLLIAVNGDSGALVLIDIAHHAVAGAIKVGGRLEFASANGDGTVYVNIESKNAIAVVDVPHRKLLREIPLKGCEEPSGLAYDAAEALVISVCGNGLAKFVDPVSGVEVASLHVAKGADAIMYDAKRRVVFIAGGDDGKLSVIRVPGRHAIRLVQTLVTQPGARLGVIDPQTGKLYLPVAQNDLSAPPMHFPGLPPIPATVPGSFIYLVVGPSETLQSEFIKHGRYRAGDWQ